MRTLSIARESTVTGKLMPWQVNQPVFAAIEGRQFVPIYSCVEKLRESMIEIGVTEYSIKIIHDGADFMKSMAEQQVPVCLDPHQHGNATRFTLVVCGDQPILSA